MSVDEFLYFLMADPKTKKGPALCLSSADFVRIKNNLEQLCTKAGKYCTYEQKALIKKIGDNVQSLTNDIVGKK